MQAFPGAGYERIERLMIERALAACGGNQVHAARLLGVTRNVIRNRMAKHRVSGVGDPPPLQ